jgi:hypothetical protein
MFRKSWVAVLALTAFAAAPAHGQMKLEWKFKEGDKFYVQDDSKMKQKVEFQGKSFTQNVTKTMVTAYEVKKVAGDTVTINQKFLDVKVNSQGEFGGDMEKAMEKLKGGSFTLTLRNGKITKFEGFDEFIKNLAGGNDMAAMFIKAVLSEDILKQSAEEAFGFLPTKPVRDGETWKRDTNVPLGPIGSFKSASQYTLEGKEKDGVKIGLKSNLTYSPPKKGDGGALAGLFTITKGNLKAENAKGYMIFDPDAGRLVRYSMSLNFRGSLTLEVAGNQIDMDVTTEQTTTSRVTTRNPLEKT